MPAGEAFTPAQHEDVRRAVRVAEQVSGLRVSVYVGELLGQDTREGASRLHAQLDDAADAVLVAVDPGRRVVEVITGSRAALRLDDRACAFAVLSMRSAFAGGDLAGGIAQGVRLLADHAVPLRTR